ncbi:MAG: AraC family transcriptional regulator [Tannerellaceae bacterium]
MHTISVLREAAKLSNEDCFLVVKNKILSLTYPVHTHPEYELILVEGANGAKRIVADSTEEIGDKDLILVSGNCPHTYFYPAINMQHVHVTSIKFHQSIFDSVKNKRLFNTIEKMKNDAEHGIVFSYSDYQSVSGSLDEIVSEDNEFCKFLKLIYMLHKLSESKDYRILGTGLKCDEYEVGERLIVEKIFAFLHENYQSDLRVSDVAARFGMTEVTFTRMLKRHVNRTFIDLFTDIRLEYVSQALIDTNDSISEICYRCGFTNISNFNRLFLKRKEMTPKEYRNKYNCCAYLL